MAGEGGLDDLGGEEGDLGDEGGEEDETLLAAPGKRYAPHTTPGAKGKVYTPVKDDKRSMGARRRSYRSKYGDEQGRNTPRNVFKGYGHLGSLSRGIYEEYATTYEEYINDKKALLEEQTVLDDSHEVTQLIENLGLERKPKKEDDDETQT